MRDKKLLKLFNFLLSLSVISFTALFTLSFPAFATTIVLDPGHSSPDKQGATEPGSENLKVGDNSGCPGERAAMQAVANEIEGDLKKDGYNVVMTKTATDSYVSLLKRAQIANNANADLAVSLHYDCAHSFGSWGQIYYQKVGLNRFNWGSNGTHLDTKTFTLSNIASKSLAYANTFSTERGKVEGITPNVTIDSFNTRGSNYSGGNIPMVQLFATIPWVYNETGGINFDKEKYRKGIVNSIEKAVPSNGRAGGNGDTATSNCVITAVGNAPANPQLPPECISGTAAGGGNQSVVQLGEKIIDSKNPRYLYIWAAPSGGYQTNTPNGFDCSGFTQWIWYHGTNKKVILPRTTSAMWNTAAAAKLQKFLPSQISQVQPGDLLLFEGGDVPPEPGHVGVYTGDNKCGGKMCYMEFASSGHPGDYASLNVNGTGVSKFFGFLRPMVQ